MSCSENTDSTDCDWDFSINPAKEITRLRAALAEAERDAARYRWLREKHNDWYSSWRIYQPHKTLGSAAIDQGLSVDIDDVIDAAMAREE